MKKKYVTQLLLCVFLSLLLIVLSIRMSLADDGFHLIEHKETSLELKNFFPGGREPMLTDGEKLNKEFDAHLDSDILKYGYWNNRVWSLVDQGQFRAVGWNWSIGLRLSRYVDVGYEHFSRHLLDRSPPNSWDGFPVSDSVNIKIYLYRRDKDVGNVLIK